MNEQDKLIQELVERSLNNSAAINVLVSIVCESGLISIDDFNKLVRKEAEEVREQMIKNVKRG